jgi:hypothetical protein
MSDGEFNYARSARLISQAINDLHLDLTGMTVYTEAATGGFAATAAIAVAAGAETVYAFTAESSYGSALEARTHTERLAKHVGNERALSFPKQKQQKEFFDADIITNTGFVRPIDDRIIGWLGPNTAVPLMYEPWEFRADDIDIRSLWNNGIPVLGTDESDYRVETQRYLQSLAVKLVYECNIELYDGTIAVVGDGQMARHAADIEVLGATVVRIRPSEISPSTEGLSTINADLLKRLDALLIVDHETDCLLVGEGGLIDPYILTQRTHGVTVIHICGPIATADLDAAGVRYVPSDPAPPQTMSYTTGYLGPRPIIDLHTAGLRVGADLVREQRAGADFQTATERVADTPLGMDFAEEIKHTHGFYNE